jgi:pimeloyl-ACP methyl ester carboxylesterase
MLRPRSPAATSIDRGFISLPHGDMHFRAAGQGEVVLALHSSPRSSVSVLPVIDALSGTYRVIAPDTPGYGLSDPLPSDVPTLNDFTGAIAAFLDCCGVQRAALYGTHTGAALALAFAERYPARVTALALDGVSTFTQAEVADFTSLYLTPYKPSWDGAHVMALWSRVKDLFTWFPWHDRTAACRLAQDPANIDALQQSALGFLQAGPHYAKAYALAAALEPNPILRKLSVPKTIFARPDDLIASHLDRIDATACMIVRLDRRPESWSAALAAAIGAGSISASHATSRNSDGNSYLIRIGDGFLHAKLAGPKDAPVRLLLPDLPGDLSAMFARERAARPLEQLLAVSPPGCGHSDPLAAETGLESVILALHAAWQALDIDAPKSCLAQGASSLLARVWSRHVGWQMDIETENEPVWIRQPKMLPTQSLLEVRAPDWHGTHLIGAWFELRDLALYDTPPGKGVPARRQTADLANIAQLDRVFRSFIEGPDAATLLEQLRHSVLMETSRAPP